MVDASELEGDDLIVHSLKQTAVRAAVTLNSLGMVQTDKAASRDIIDAKRSIAGASVVKVSRLPGADAHDKAIRAAQNRGRTALHARSMPYGDHIGWRLLPNRNLIPVMQEFGQARKEHEEAHARFMDDVANVLAAARANLGDFDVRLPTEEEIAKAYSMKIDFEEIPDGRYEGIDQDLARKLSKHTKERVVIAFQSGQAEVLPRILEPVAVFAERMQAFEEREMRLLAGEGGNSRTGHFRDAVVENLKPLAEALRGFNLTQNPRLETLAERVASLAQVDPSLLRTEPAAREKSRREAVAIMETLKDWSG